MTTIHDLRRAANERGHHDDCRAWVTPSGDYPDDNECDCGQTELLTTLDAAEKHLPGLVFKIALECHTRGRMWGKEGMTKEAMEELECYINRELTAFLNPKDETDAAT